MLRGVEQKPGRSLEATRSALGGFILDFFFLSHEKEINLYLV